MQNKRLKIAVCVMSATLLFSSMNIESFADEGTVLPSAGIDYFLSSNGTSVKNLKDEEEIGQEKQETENAQETAAPTASSTPAADNDASVTSPVEKVIEETAEAYSDKTIPEKEREMEAKKEEKKFRSLVIAQVNNYVNVRSLPSEEGEILGKLYDKSVGEFVSEQDGWYEREKLLQFIR